MWGGWKRNAPPESRAAYRLNKMDNIWSLTGQAVEESVMRALRQVQAGRLLGPEEVFETVARPFLRQKWTESKRGEWQENPKQKCCLREHYYGVMGDEKAVAERITAQIKACVDHFYASVLPRLKQIGAEQELPVRTANGAGDPEHILFNGVKVYVIPDYAYRIGGAFHIHDWKAGKVKASHREQLGLYALWAREKFRARPEDIFLYVEYLREGQVAPFQLDTAGFAAMEDRIESSVAEMSEYLVDFDREKNEPLPCEEWELAADPDTCSTCNFYELCFRTKEIAAAHG